MKYEIIPFSYSTHHVIRRIPNEIGRIWAALVDCSVGNNEGFYCRSFLNGQHSGDGEPNTTEWLVARDENGNWLIAAPR